MSLVLEAVGVVLWIVFAALGVIGAGLVVEVVALALDRNRRGGADFTRVRAGRWSQLRRYAIYWVSALVLWTAAVLATNGFRGASCE